MGRGSDRPNRRAIWFDRGPRADGARRRGSRATSESHPFKSPQPGAIRLAPLQVPRPAAQAPPRPPPRPPQVPVPQLRRLHPPRRRPGGPAPAQLRPRAGSPPGPSPERLRVPRLFWPGSEFCRPLRPRPPAARGPVGSRAVTARAGPASTTQVDVGPDRADRDLRPRLKTCRALKTGPCAGQPPPIPTRDSAAPNLSLGISES